MRTSGYLGEHLSALAGVELADQRGALSLRQLEHREQLHAAALAEEVEEGGAEVVHGRDCSEA
jgi:hypothetical protein